MKSVINTSASAVTVTVAAITAFSVLLFEGTESVGAAGDGESVEGDVEGKTITLVSSSVGAVMPPSA